ncbi:class I SAM-dependent methyltransferase, partial [bacterium]|nr:class I SAM-dependent methyltransferase [bacterium]
VLIGDCENIPFPDNSVDFYTAMGVIEYMDSDEPMIRECRRVLKPGGTGILTARNVLCPAVRWRFFYEDLAKPVAAKIVAPLRNGRIPPERIPISREHSPFALKRTLRKNGFDILAQRFCHFYVLPHPFGQMFRPIEAVLARPLEVLAATPLGILGSTYIVKFRKRT